MFDLIKNFDLITLQIFYLQEPIKQDSQCNAKFINQMLRNNFISKKPEGNSKLLGLLTNRQRAKSLTNIRQQWPGKHTPNFTLTISQSHKTMLQPSSRHKSFSLLKPRFTNSVPSVQIAQTGQLSLKPSTSNLLSRQATEFHRNSRSNKSSRKSSVIKIQQNDESMNASRIFKNSKINKKVNQVIEKELYYTARQQKQSKNVLQTIVSNRTFTNDIAVKSKKKQAKVSPNKHQPINKYKIDFMAFGFIEKVLQNPQLWTKYVRKVQNNNFQITNPQNETGPQI